MKHANQSSLTLLICFWFESDPFDFAFDFREYTQRLGISYLEAVPDADEYKLNFRQVK